MGTKRRSKVRGGRTRRTRPRASAIARPVGQVKRGRISSAGTPRRRSRPRENAPRIVVDERIVSGRPVIKGTRVPVETLLGQLAGGMSVREVADEYGVRPKDVLAAIAYAAEVISDERVLPTRE